MVKGSHFVADVLTKDHIFEKGILFFPGCRSAKLTCEALNEREPDCALYLDGSIVGETRRDLVNRLKAGEWRWLCNVGIATEGFNWPEASVVGMCTPTFSKPAYAQRVGRGTRPLAGLLNGLSTSGLRKAAIAASNKPSMLILDFVGVSAELDLVSHESFLEDPAKDATSTTKEPADRSDDGEEFEEPEESFIDGPNINLRAIARGIKSESRHIYYDFNPFEPSGVTGDALDLKHSDIGKEPPLSHKQYQLLCRNGIDDESLTKKEAQKLVGFIAQHKFQLGAVKLSVLKKLYADVINEREERFC